ncbi:MAG: DUF4876 domain-containing protein [Ignavibacteria bacterium]
MKRIKLLLPLMICLIIFIMQGCAEKPPVMADGESNILLRAYWNRADDTSRGYLPMQNAKVILSSEYGIMVKYTDVNGVLDMKGIPTASYNVSVRMTHPDDPGILLVGNKTAVSTHSGSTVTDTIFSKAVSNSGIALNEVYISGPVNNQFYFSDQFLELYNSGDSVKYLDGMMVMRFSGNGDTGQKGPGADEGNDGDIDGATYIYKFPGHPGEMNYPFLPKKFLVLASKAIDHRRIVSASIDLSNADWEFYNQFSTTDIDNPAVPNLINMKLENTTKFLLSLVSDVVIISDGRDMDWRDGINISTILDGAEYQSTVGSQKTLDTKIDKGFVLSPTRYSCKSMQRREPGIDTNDGNMDWEIIPHPTPGYQ